MWTTLLCDYTLIYFDNKTSIDRRICETNKNQINTFHE